MTIEKLLKLHEEANVVNYPLDATKDEIYKLGWKHGASFAYQESQEDIEKSIDKVDRAIEVARKRGADEERKKSVEIDSCLREAVDLMEAVVNSNYFPDSFTTQPWREVLEMEEE